MCACGVKRGGDDRAEAALVAVDVYPLHAGDIAVFLLTRGGIDGSLVVNSNVRYT
jgi:hypothetical protein